MLDILNYDPAELSVKLSNDFGLEKFRGKQLRPWLYRRHVTNFEEMTDIAKPVRVVLAENFRIFRPNAVQVLVSQDGTRKFLFELPDGARVETVLIKQPARNTLCVSSQVGCGMGCVFCRTASMGFKRNLEAFEILGQVLAVKDYVASSLSEADADSELDFSNIVFMGMGEPLHNYENVVKAVRILNDELGLSYSSRKITVSTSGLVPEIRRFGAEEVGANIAISLNATTDEVRSRIMPINRKWPIAQLMAALREVPTRRNKHITIEYVMLRGINDSAQDMARLPRLLHGIETKLNLIPYNANSGLGYESPDSDTVMDWQRNLCAAGINTRVRWSKGEDISAACGQLAVQLEKKVANS